MANYQITYATPAGKVKSARVAGGSKAEAFAKFQVMKPSAAFITIRQI